MLSNPDTPLPVRTRFIDYNPIPGARWTDMVLTNMNNIWPENYDYGQLSFDVRSYQLLLANASNKVFKGFIRLVDWNGRGSKPLVACLKPLQTNIVSKFRANTLIYMMVGPSMSVMVWSGDKSLTAMDLLIGASTFLGETLDHRSNSVRSVAAIDDRDDVAYAAAVDFIEI
ncbi:hypothetical protein RUM43_004838 [Polyplax serrata]|uniref:Uncharacterized protein n=1 Tax=Polyplax serrata TaxID=468196 RepID=A0AAN8SB98_POLSC